MRDERSSLKHVQACVTPPDVSGTPFRAAPFSSRNTGVGTNRCIEGNAPADGQTLLVKWKNIDVGPGDYYITGTLTEWLPLFNRDDIRALLCDQIRHALAECGGFLAAFVIMPDHIHLLVYLPQADLLHKFNKLWRGRSGYKIIKLLKTQADADTLQVMASHANGKARYAAWKEQVRALAIWNQKKLHAMIDYIHHNPVRRRLVPSPEEWLYSSCRFYDMGEPVVLDIVPPEV